MSFDNIPLELRSCGNFWLNWRTEAVANTAKLTKRPLNSRTGHYGSVTNPNDWVSYNQAVDAHHAAGGLSSGIGFVFSKIGNPGDATWNKYGGIDLDNPFDETLTYEQGLAILHRQEAIEAKFDSYTEYSPSRKGVHIIIGAQVPDGRRRDKVELYTDARFFTMTGDIFKYQRPIADRQFDAGELWKELRASELREIAESRSQEVDDQTIVDRASAAANGDKFLALLKGDQLDYPSQSEADIALINIIMFYSGNVEQTERIFRASGLFREGKQHHIRGMVAKSLDKMPTLPDIPGLQAEIEAYQASIPLSSNGRTPAFEAANLGSIPSDGTIAAPYDVLPPGLVGDLARFVYAQAVKPNKALSIAAAISLMAGTCGRAFNVSGTGVNLYTLALAPTGMGKEGMAQGINRLLTAAAVEGAQTAHEVIGPAEIASGQALTKHLVTKPFFLALLGEFGIKLGTITGRNASSAEQMLLRALLDLFNKSGKGDVMRGSIYSQKENNTEMVNSPALSILAETTPETLFKSLSEENIASGLVSRFLFIEATGDVPPTNEHRQFDPPAPVAAHLARVVVTSFGLNHSREVVNVILNGEAYQMSRDFDNFCNSQINGSNKEISRQLWNRANLIVLKLSALVAIGVNEHAPVITPECYQWAKNLTVHSVGIMLGRFDTGELGGADGDQEAQLRAVKQAVKQFYTDDNVCDKYKIVPAWKAGNIVPFRFLQVRTANVSAFRHDRLGHSVALERTLKTLGHSGYLTELSSNECTKRVGISSRGFILADVGLLR